MLSLRRLALTIVVGAVLGACGRTEPVEGPELYDDPGVCTTMWSDVPTTEVTAPGEAVGFALDAAGRVLVAGSSRGALLVMRLTRAGLDGAFGDAGVIRVQREGCRSLRGTSVTTDAQSRYLVAAECEGLAGQGHVVIARLLDSGAPDTSFGDKGSVLVAVERGVAALSPRVFVSRSGALRVAARLTGAPADFLAAGLTRDGAVQTTFGQGGVYLYRVSTQNSTRSLARFDALLESNDGLVLAGQRTISIGDVLYAGRLSAAGVPDDTFRSFQGDPVELPPTLSAVSVGPMGGLVFAGGSDTRMFVRRTTADGDGFRLFGREGSAQITPPTDFTVEDVAADRSGGALVLGSVGYDNGTTSAALLRLRDDGSLDTDFGNDGLLRITGERPELAVGFACDASGLPVVVTSGDGRVVVRWYRQ